MVRINGSEIKRLKLQGGLYYYRVKRGRIDITIPLGTGAEAEALKKWTEYEANPGLVVAYANKAAREKYQLKTVSEAYMADAGRLLSVNSVKAYRAALNRICEYFGEHRRVDEITRPEIIAYHRSRSDTPYQANLDARVLAVMLQWAWDEGIINGNPAFRIKKNREQRQVLNLSVEILFRDIYRSATPALQRAIMLAFHLVQHTAEVRALRWDQFDLPRGMVRFVRQKTNQEISIDYSQNTAFCAWLTQIRQKTIENNEISEFIVCYQDAQGQWQPYQSLQDMWDKALIGSGHQAGAFRFKEIRHLANTLLKDAGIGADQRCALTGHKSNANNERYTHASAQDTVAAGAALGQAQEG